MKVKDLRALLENVTDDLPVMILREDRVVELDESDVDIVTFEGERFIGPTVLLINTDEQYQGESED